MWVSPGAQPAILPTCLWMDLVHVYVKGVGGVHVFDHKTHRAKDFAANCDTDQ